MVAQVISTIFIQVRFTLATLGRVLSMTSRLKGFEMQTKNISKSTSSDLAERMENNSISAFRLIDGVSWADLIENDEATEFVSGLPIPWMNVLFKTTTTGFALQGLIDKTLRRCDQLKCPMLWKVSDQRLDRDEQKSMLAANGLALSGSETAMVLDSRKFRFSKNHEEIRIEPVTNYAGIRDWLAPYVAAFNIPEDLLQYFQRLTTSKFMLAAGKEFWFVAYLNDIPVASASSLYGSGITMIYNVGTVPKFCGRGFARSITEALIKHTYECKQNPVALYATKQSFPLFRNLGFDELHDVEIYRYEPKTVKERSDHQTTLIEGQHILESSALHSAGISSL